jgi:drug/metabolite transporter (DMT)-like permease
LSEKFSAIFGLIVSSFIFAIVGISYKLFISIGIAFISFFWITRLLKLLTVYGIMKARGINIEIISDRRELFFLYLNGFFSVISPIFFALALIYTKVSTAYFLSYTMPAWTLIFSVAFLGEKISLKKLFGIMLTVIGIFLITQPGDLSLVNLGFIFGVLTAFSHAGDIITSRELKDYKPELVSFYSNFFQFVIFTLAFFAMSKEIIFWEPIIIFYLIIIGILLGVASSFYYYSLHYIEASKAAIISLTELIFALFLGMLLLQETHSIFEWFGYLFIILAAGIFILRKSSIQNFTRLINFKRKY